MSTGSHSSANDHFHSPKFSQLSPKFKELNWTFCLLFWTGNLRTIFYYKSLFGSTDINVLKHTSFISHGCTRQSNSFNLKILFAEPVLLRLPILIVLLSLYFFLFSYCQTQNTENTWNFSGVLIVYWLITIKFRICKQTSKSQRNYRCSLRFSYLAPYWLISRNTITVHKYFWCSRFTEFRSKSPRSFSSPQSFKQFVYKKDYTYEVERSCTWTLAMTWPCHRSKWLSLPHPLSCIFFHFFLSAYI